MGDIDKLIDNYRQQISDLVTEMEHLERAGDMIIQQIDNIDNLVDSEGNDPTSVAEPVLAEQRKDQLLEDIETITKRYMELEDTKNKLINHLRSLASRIGTRRGGKKI